MLLFPHSVTYIETLEVLSTGPNIGGTCHSKVGVASLGVGHIGTIMGPNYSGNCFVPLHNPTDHVIVLSVGDTFMSVVFNYLDTPMQEMNATIGGHTDKFSTLGIHATQEETSKLNEDWKRSHQEICKKMKNDAKYIEFRHQMRKQWFFSLFSKRRLLVGVIIAVVCVGLALMAGYVDKIHGNTIWSDRYWTVMAAGVVMYILQLIVQKK